MGAKMTPQFTLGNVRARCPNCDGAITSFEHMIRGSEFGSINRPLTVPREFNKRQFGQVIYHLLRCASCGTGALAAVLIDDRGYSNGHLDDFFPRTIDTHTIPKAVPSGVQSEFKEAELCASVGAWRAASSLLRSTLEKTLRANGYAKGSLAERIDQAAADGTITAARSKRAHEDIRVLGNDVLHDEWRQVTADEFDQAHRYAQRILEDFYDDRPTVEALLISKGRMKGP